MLLDLFVVANAWAFVALMLRVIRGSRDEQAQFRRGFSETEADAALWELLKDEDPQWLRDMEIGPPAPRQVPPAPKPGDFISVEHPSDVYTHYQKFPF